jgi:hypothetical protein
VAFWELYETPPFRPEAGRSNVECALQDTLSGIVNTRGVAAARYRLLRAVGELKTGVMLAYLEPIRMFLPFILAVFASVSFWLYRTYSK